MDSMADTKAAPLCAIYAEVKERQALAAAFAELPVHVLWRLSDKEVPDQQAITDLGLGNNTNVASHLQRVHPAIKIK